MSDTRDQEPLVPGPRVSPAGDDTWFPPSTTNPLPVAIVSANDPGVHNWWPPSYTNPLPVAVVSGSTGGPGGGIPEAPTTGLIYGRQGSTASWLQVLPITGGTLTGELTLPATAPSGPNVATNRGYVDSSIANLSLTYAPLASPQFTGTPRSLTPPAPGDNSNALATTSFVKGQGYLTANQAITLSGDVTGSGMTAIAATVARIQTVPVSAVAPSANQVLQFVGGAWTPQPPPAGGVSQVTATTPIIASPTIGAVALSLTTVPVALGGTGATNAPAALTALGAAPIASPVFTGDPRAPTPAPGDSDTSIATTAFVMNAVSASGGISGTLTANQLVLGTGAATVAPLPAGNAGYYLQSNGAGNAPSWVGLTTGSGTVVASPQYQLPYYGSAGTMASVQGNARITTDTTGMLSVNLNTAALPAVTAPGVLSFRLGGSDTNTNNAFLDSFGSGGGGSVGGSIIHFRRANGTAASPLALADQDLIGGISAHGHAGLTDLYTPAQVGISFITRGAWATGSHGGQIVFNTTPTGSTVNATAAMISKGLVVGLPTAGGEPVGALAVGDMGVGTVNAASGLFVNGTRAVLDAPTTPVGTVYGRRGDNNTWQSVVPTVGGTMTGNLTINAPGLVTTPGALDVQGSVFLGSDPINHIVTANVAYLWVTGVGGGDLYVDRECFLSGNVRVGAPTPAIPGGSQIGDIYAQRLHVSMSKQTAAIDDLGPSTVARFLQDNGVGCRVIVEGFGGNPSLLFRRSQGLGTVPGYPLHNDVLGHVIFEGGYNNPSAAFSARIAAVANEPTAGWTATAQGSFLQFDTAPTGSTGTYVQAIMGPGLQLYGPNNTQPTLPGNGMQIGDLNVAGRIMVNGSPITGGGNVGAGAQNQLAFYSATNAVSGNTHITENGSGTTISYNAAAALPAIATPGTTALRLAAPDTQGLNVYLDAFGGIPATHYRRAPGTNPPVAGTTAGLADGDIVAGVCTSHGWDGQAYSAAQGGINTLAHGAWSTTSHGMRIEFTTTPINSTAVAMAMALRSGLILYGPGTTAPLGGTNGDMGYGTLNVANGLYVNGSAVNPGFAESVAWLGGVNPHKAIIFTNNLGRVVTVVSIIAAIENSNGTATTIDVYQATGTNTLAAGGIKVNTTSFNAAGVQGSTLTMLSGGNVQLAVGDRLGVLVAGNPTFDTSVAAITVYMQ